MTTLTLMAGIQTPGWAKGGGAMPDEVRLLWTNDTHGLFLPIYHAELNNLDAYVGIAATEGTLGGYAQIVTLVKKLRPVRLNVLLTDYRAVVLTQSASSIHAI